MSFYNSFRLVMVASIILFAVPTHAHGWSISNWLWNPPFASDLKGELQCFAMPYGGIGFASHILTYYTIIMLTLHRSPIFFKLNTWWRFDIALAIFSLLSTITVTTLTIIRCRNRWQFICLAVWKLDMSVTLCFIALNSARTVSKGIKYTRIKQASDVKDLKEHLSGKGFYYLLWLLPYLPGILAGLVGLMSIVRQVIATNSRVRIITIVFSIIWGLPTAIGLLYSGCRCCRGRRKADLEKQGGDKKASHSYEGFLWGFGTSVIFVVILGPFYCDWILAAIGNDLAGVPSSDNAVLYWSYFAAKRLPGLSF